MRPLSREDTAERIPFQDPEGSQFSGLGAPADRGGDGRAPGGSLHTSLQRPTAWLVLEPSHASLPWGWSQGGPCPVSGNLPWREIHLSPPPRCSVHVALAVSLGHF